MDVVGIVHQKLTNTPSDGIRYYSCDLLDRVNLEETIRDIKPDYVLHLGGKNSVPEAWEKPLLYLESNVMATLFLLNALRPFPSCRILVAGSRLSFPLLPPYHPAHPYSLSKSLQSAGALCWASLFGQSVIIAEPSNLMGPGPSSGFCSLLGRHISGLERGEVRMPFTLSSPKDRRDFLDVRDAVRAYASLLFKGQQGSTYQISSGIDRTLFEAASLMIKLASCSVPLTWGQLDDSLKNNASQALEQPSAPEHLPITDWQPEIPIEQSFADILYYFRTEEEGRHAT